MEVQEISHRVVLGCRQSGGLLGVREIERDIGYDVFVPGKGFLEGLMLRFEGFLALSLAFSALDMVGEGGPNREWKVPADFKRSGLYMCGY